MALDKVLIGNRIRKIREELFKESRKDFSQRCGLTERHIGQIERGEFLASLPTLDKISSETGVDTDFILYGKDENKHLKIKVVLNNIIDKADKEELGMYYKFIIMLKNYIKIK